MIPAVSRSFPRAFLEVRSLREISESFPGRDAHIGVPEAPLGVSQTTTNVSGTLVAGPVTPIAVPRTPMGVPGTGSLSLEKLNTFLKEMCSDSPTNLNHDRSQICLECLWISLKIETSGLGDLKNRTGGIGDVKNRCWRSRRPQKSKSAASETSKIEDWSVQIVGFRLY